MSDGSSITVFLLLAFADIRDLQLLHSWLFLGIYLGALLGNGLIITAIACDHPLHTSMYFFLLNLSLIDLGCISTNLPKAMANSLWDARAISFLGCAVQIFLFTFLISAEFCLLTVMVYDCHVAICKSLHYGALLGSRACVHMAAAAWGSGFVHSLLHTANKFSLPLCQGNGIDQFFCEIPQIIKLSCLDINYLRKDRLVVLSACLFFVCFVSLWCRMCRSSGSCWGSPLSRGSTCLSQLAVVFLFISSGMFAYMKFPSISPPSLDIVMAVVYSVVPPALNPLIYNMRNQELKDALRKQIQSILHHEQ